MLDEQEIISVIHMLKANKNPREDDSLQAEFFKCWPSFFTPSTNEWEKGHQVIRAK